MLLSNFAFAARPWWPAFMSACMGCAAAASVVYWVLQFPSGGTASSVPLVSNPASMARPAGSEDTAHLQRAWGVNGLAPVMSVAQSSRYQLLGVVAGASGQGSALIAIDGQAPKAYRAGQALSEGLFLQSLNQRQAQVGAAPTGPSSFTLSLPALNKTP